MSAPQNNVLIIIVLAIIAVGGFLFGRSQLDRPLKPTQETTIKAATDGETPIADSKLDKNITEPQPANAIEYHYIDETRFEVASPNVGPLITTVMASLDANNQTIQFNNDTPQSRSVGKGDNVILYNKDGSVHLREVKIGFVGQTEVNGFSIAGLDFDGALDKEALGDKATIIAKETFAVKRLPLKAVMKDSDGKEYVWVATPLDKNKEPTIFASANELLVNKAHVDTRLNDYNFFEVPSSILTTQLVILNPNEALKENTILPTVSVVSLNAPQGTMLFEARMKASIENAQADIASSFEQAEQCVANAEAMIDAVPIPDLGDMTGKQSTRSQANELPQADTAGACGGAPAAGSCGGGSAGSCGGGSAGSCGGGSAGSCGGDTAGSCGGGSAGSCGGGAPSACGADPYLSDFNSEPPAQMIDPYILLGIEPLSE